MRGTEKRSSAPDRTAPCVMRREQSDRCAFVIDLDGDTASIGPKGGRCPNSARGAGEPLPDLESGSLLPFRSVPLLEQRQEERRRIPSSASSKVPYWSLGLPLIQLKGFGIHRRTAGAGTLNEGCAAWRFLATGIIDRIVIQHANENGEGMALVVETAQIHAAVLPTQDTGVLASSIRIGILPTGMDLWPNGPLWRE